MNNQENKNGKVSCFLKKFFDIKFWKFILVGIINTVVGEGVVLLLTNPVGWKQYSWGPGAAAFIGVVVGSIVSFFLNKSFTFKNKEKGWKDTFAGNLSWAVGAAVFVMVNYIGQRFFAFKEKKEENK